jgi:hypothetical protein|tara:strand:+ start:622 stop:3879 length:3258 start_codon:yes stop_codon:yes gene_type:complete
MSLIAHYPLIDNTSDIVGGNPDGVTVNGTIDATGKVGSCYTNMSSGAIETGIPDMNHSWSIAGWWRHNSTAAESTAFAGTRSGNSGWMLYRNAGDTLKYFRWYLHYNNTSGTVSNYQAWHGVSNIPDLEWVHFVITHDINGSTSIYMNGVKVVDVSTPSGFSSWRLGNTLELGGGGSNGWAATNVSVNDYRLYNHILSEKEVEEIVKAKVLHYTFNDLQEPTTNEFDESLMVNSGYGGPGVVQNIDDAFGTRDNIVRRITQGKVRFGVTNGTDVGTLYYGKTYTFSIYLRSPTGVLDSGMEFDINDQSSSRSYTGSLESNITAGWKRFSVTATHTNNSNYHFIDIGKYLGTGVWDWCCAQIEEKNHSTPFTKSSRTGTVTDVSGFGNDSLALSESSTPEWTIDSILGTGGYSFLKTNETRIRSPKVDLYDKTVSFWVKLDSGQHTSSEAVPFLTYNDGNLSSAGLTNQILLCMQSNSFRMHGWGSGDPICTTNINDGNWHHLVWQMKYHETDATQRVMNMWIDGNREVTNFNYSQGAFPPNSSSYWWLAYNSRSYSPYLRAGSLSMDDVRIYASVLSNDDVLELYNTRAQLDDTGNLFLGEIDINGIGSKNSLIPYEKMVDQTQTSEINYYDDDGGNNYKIYNPPSRMQGTIGNFINPQGELDQMFRTQAITSAYTQNSQQSHRSFFNVDPTKKYRVSQWVYTHSPTSASTSRHYFGMAGNTVCNLNTTTLNSNPYMTYPQMQDGNANGNWVLWVYYIFPYGSTGNVADGGWYKPDGTFINTGTDYNWANITSSHTRQYFMYQYSAINIGDYILAYRPRVDIVDSSEPTVESLIECTEHRPVINDAGKRKSISSNSKGYFTDVSEVGITDGLVGYWPLNGNAEDYSGNGNDGTVTGAVVSGGLKDLAYDFNYTTDKIEIGAIGNLSNNFTISCIFNSNNIANSQNMISRNGPYFLGIRSSKIWGGVYAGGSWSWPAGGAALASDTWYHACLTYDGVNAKIYVNGVLQNSTAQSGIVNSNGTLRLGYTTGGANAPMDGKISSVKIFNNSLTPEEILIEYKHGLTNTGMQIERNGTLFLNSEINEGL